MPRSPAEIVASRKPATPEDTLKQMLKAILQVSGVPTVTADKTVRENGPRVRISVGKRPDNSFVFSLIGVNIGEEYLHHSVDSLLRGFDQVGIKARSYDEHNSFTILTDPVHFTEIKPMLGKLFARRVQYLAENSGIDLERSMASGGKGRG